MIRFGKQAMALVAMTTGLTLPAAAETTYGEPLSDLKPVRIGETRRASWTAASRS